MPIGMYIFTCVLPEYAFRQAAASLIAVPLALMIELINEKKARNTVVIILSMGEGINAGTIR